MVTSHIFFTRTPQAKKARRWRLARPGCEDLRERRRRETTWEGSMSGGFLFWVGAEHIRAQQLEVHQARIGNAVLAPLRHRALGDATQAGNLNGPPECVDNFVGFCVHVASVDVYTTKLQHLKHKNV